MKREVMFRMLKNAGSIQYMQNIIDNSDRVEFEVDKNGLLTVYWGDDGVIQFFEKLDKQESRFFLKGRKLRSGLSNGLARRLAWNAYNKLEERYSSEATTLKTLNASNSKL